MTNALVDEAGRAVSGAGAAGARGLRREAPTCGPGVAGRRGGKLGLSAGRAGEGRPRRGPVARGCWAAAGNWVWAAMGFLPFFYFLIQTNSNQTNYLNSNFKFEFNPNTQTK